MKQYNWDDISEAASFRLSQHIEDQVTGADRETTRNARQWSRNNERIESGTAPMVQCR